MSRIEIPQCGGAPPGLQCTMANTVSLDRKTYIITDPTFGIGRATAFDLAKHLHGRPGRPRSRKAESEWPPAPKNCLKLDSLCGGVPQTREARMPRLR